MLIRDCAVEDIPAITAIYSEAVLNGTATFELDPPDEQEMAHRREKLIAGGYPYLIAEIDGEIVGYAYASQYRPRIGYRYTIENSVYVKVGKHGKGIGQALMNRLIAACEAQGFRQMVAVIGDSTNQASIRLHKRLGFTHIGTLRSLGRKHGKWLDTVLMQRSLGLGDASAP